MADRVDWFGKFDALPIDHSHGNLCAWRGVLQLYEITGDRKYLDMLNRHYRHFRKNRKILPKS